MVFLPSFAAGSGVFKGAGRKAGPSSYTSLALRYRAIGGALGVSHTQARHDAEPTGKNFPVDQPDRVVGLDGKSYPPHRPLLVPARNDQEARRAQDALQALPQDALPFAHASVGQVNERCTNSGGLEDDPMLTAERHLERRIGELLGPAEHGGDRRSDQVPRAVLEKNRAREFRLIAENWAAYLHLAELSWFSQVKKRVYSQHALARMSQRRVSKANVEAVLAAPLIERPSKEGQGRRVYTGRPDGRKVEVVVQEEGNRVLVITVWTE